MDKYVLMTRKEIEDAYGYPGTYTECLDNATTFMNDERDCDELFILEVQKIITRSSIQVQDFKEF